MLNGALKRTAIAMSIAFGIMAAPPVFAAGCPAGKEGARDPGPSVGKGVTDTVIASIDLKDYGADGKMMRMRRLVIEPGGVVPWHSHAKRPANIYIISGEITEYRSTCTVGIEHAAGDVTAEHGDISHWWRNNTKKKTVLISADVVPDEMMNEGGM